MNTLGLMMDFNTKTVKVEKYNNSTSKDSFNYIPCDCGHIEHDIYRVYERTSKGKVCMEWYLKLLEKKEGF